MTGRTRCCLIASLLLLTATSSPGRSDESDDTKSPPLQPLKLLLVADPKADDVGLRTIVEKTANEYASSNLKVDVITRSALMEWITENCRECANSQDGLKAIRYAEKKGYAVVGGFDAVIKRKSPRRRLRAQGPSDDSTPREIAPWIYNLRRGSYSFGVDQTIPAIAAPIRLTDSIEFRSPSRGKLPFTIPVDFARETSYEPNSLMTSLKMHEQLEAWAWGSGGLFVLNGTNGGRIDLTQIKSRLILISFWGAHPPASEAYLLPLQLIQRKHPQSDLCWLSINADLGRTEWLRYVEQNPLDGMQCILGQSNVQPDFSQYYRVFVMDRERKSLKEYEITDISIVIDRLLGKDKSKSGNNGGNTRDEGVSPSDK